MAAESLPSDQNIVSLAAKRSEKRSAEVIDFSEASAEIAIDFFMSELNHPSRMQWRGEKLAEFIDSELHPRDTSDRAALQTKLSMLVESADVAAVHSEKTSKDDVFKLLFNLMLETKDQARQYRAQRHATMSLLQLRSATPQVHKTPNDGTWRDVAYRLFN